MKKKFINGLLLLAVATFGCTTFTSCKDSEEDLKNQMEQNDQQLKDLYEALKAAQHACTESCKDQFANITKILEGKVDKTTLEKLEKYFKDEIDRLSKLPHLTREDVMKICDFNYIKGLGFLTEADVEQMGFLKSADLTDITNNITNIYEMLNGMEGEGGIVTQITNIENNYTNLADDVKKLQEEGISNDEVVKLIDAAKTELKTLIDNLEKRVAANEANIKDHETRIKALEDLKVAVEERFTKIEGDIQGLKGRVDVLETENGEIKGQITDINGNIKTIEGRLTAAEKDALAAKTQAELNKQSIKTHQALLEGLRSDVDGLRADLDPVIEDLANLHTQLEELIERLDAKDAELAGKIEALSGRIDGIDETLAQYAIDFEDLTKRVAANEEAIKKLQEEVLKIQKLENRLDQLVTGIIVQGVYNPLFGTFSLPIGVQSNMLVNYWGKSENLDYEFPSVQQIASCDKEPEISEMESAVLSASGLVPFTVKNGEIMLSESNANLGKVFVTVNPNNVDFTGKTLELVNSQDQKAKVELSELRRSDAVLTFGYSARAAENGFYEADVKLPATDDAVNGTAIHIDQNLKTAIKDILKDRRSGLRANVLQLMKAVYDQVNGMLPAYGLKAGWTVDGKDYAVYSNYNLAATTFRPLSFGFLYDQSLGSRRLPIIDPISNAILNLDPDDYKFDFSDVKVNINGDDIKLNFSLSPIEIKYNGTLGISTTVDFTVSGEIIGAVGTPQEGEVIGTFEKELSVPVSADVPKEEIDKLLKQIQDTFNASIDGWNESINDAFADAMNQMIDKVNAAVEDMLAQMQGKINDKIADMIEGIQDNINGKFGNYIDRFNSLITRYNQLAKRLNNILENPNHYLQLTMFYKGGNGGDYFLSNNKENPTVFVKEGGEGFMAYATSYTAEVVAPAFKKVVAVTDVIDPTTGMSVPGAIAQCAEINKSTSYLAEVVSGVQKRFVIPTKDMKSGYTYEILYTAVDYHGVTSTARYYVTVK